jgi:hypothetical protein
MIILQEDDRLSGRRMKMGRLAYICMDDEGELLSFLPRPPRSRLGSPADLTSEKPVSWDLAATQCHCDS